MLGSGYSCCLASVVRIRIASRHILRRGAWLSKWAVAGGIYSGERLKSAAERSEVGWSDLFGVFTTVGLSTLQPPNSEADLSPNANRWWRASGYRCPLQSETAPPLL